MANRVQVTIGADDEATVVLKKVQLELQRLGGAATRADAATGRVTSNATKNVGGFTKAVSGASAALGTLGIAVTAAGLVAFAKQSVDAADALNDLRQQTGVNAGTLQALGLVADQSGASMDDLSGIFARLSKALVELRQGDKTTVATFKAIGLSAKDLANATPDQALVRVASALTKVSDPANKSAIAMRLLGRSGAEVIPFLDALANDALPKATAELGKFGALLSDDTIQAADEFNDQLALMKTVSKGLLANVIADMIQTAKAVKELNDATGHLVGSIPGVRLFGETVSDVWRRLAAMTGNPLNPFSLLATQVENVLSRVQAVRRAVAGTQSFAFRDVEGGASSAPLGTLSGDIPDFTKVAAIENARLAAERASAQRTLAARVQAIAAAEAADRAAFDRGLESLDAYYRNRVQRIRDGVSAEVQSLQAERNALAASPVASDDPAAAVNRQQQLADLAGKIAQAKAKGAADEAAAGRDRLQMEQDLTDRVLAFEGQLAQLRGDGLTANVEASRQWLRDYETALTQMGVKSEEVANRVRAAWSLRTDADSFEDTSRRMQQAMASLETDRDAIRQKAAQGLLSESQAEQQILALEQSRLPNLRAIQTAMADIAARLGDPALIDAAKRLGVELGNVGVKVRDSDIALKNIGTTIREGMTNDLATFLGSTINQVQGFGDALNKLALSFLSTIQQALAKVIATRAMEVVFDIGKDSGTAASATALGAAGATVAGAAAATTASAGALGAAGATVLSAAAAMTAAAAALAAARVGGLGLATGGYVSGPGTGTSDSIPAWLSNGEYVIRADAVKRLGVSYLNAINSGGFAARASVPRVARYAGGGLVSSAALTGGAAGGVVEVRMRDELLEARVLDTLESKEAQRIHVKNAHRNRKALEGGR